jgi:predicted transcriptional regulator
MEKEPDTILDNLNRFLTDGVCQRILDVMTMQDIFEQNKKRYNELYRIIQAHGRMSKPTFDEHTGHLIKKRLIVRRELGKQEVYFYLNEHNMMIKNLHETKNQIQQEQRKIEEKLIPWDQIPAFLSNYFAMCELRRTRVIFKHFFDRNPQKKQVDLLALAWQAKMMQTLQTKMIVNMAEMLAQAKTKDERQLKLARTLSLLDQAIEKANKGIFDTMH